MKIENLNLLIPFIDENEDLNTCYIPQPNKILFDSVAGILGYFYTKIRTGNLLPEVFVTDWEFITNEIIKSNNLDETSKSKLDNFLEKMLISSHIVKPNGSFESFNDVKLDDESISTIKGYALFSCALFRYTPAQARKSVLGHLLTSQSVAEFSGSLKKPSNEASMESKASAKRKGTSMEVLKS